MGNQPPDLYKTDGTTLANAEVLVYERSEVNSYSEDDILIVTFDPHLAEYSVIYGPSTCSSGIRPFVLTSAMITGSASVTWDDCDGGVGTVHDRNDVYSHGCSTDTGYAALIKRAAGNPCVDQWEIIDLRCDDGSTCGGS